jgi:hypothetical protein
VNKPVTNLKAVEAQGIPSIPADGDPGALAKLREPFPPHQVSKLPKESKAQADERKANRASAINCQVCGGWHHRNAVHLDYVGHAALTDRLLDVDPLWSWEPCAFTADGLPAFDRNGGLWIKLTICGVTRLGYGNADGKQGGDAVKEIIGDALRNAAMRFGAALDLWHKGDLHAEEPEPVASAEEMAINLLKGCGSKELFKEAWEKNKDGWRGVMERDAYARVVAVMKDCAARFAEPLPSPPPAADDFGLGDEEVPF